MDDTSRRIPSHLADIVAEGAHASAIDTVHQDLSLFGHFGILGILRVVLCFSGTSKGAFE